MTKENFQLWRERLFKLTHALILPLSILVIASLLLGIGQILEVSNFKNTFTLLLKSIGSIIFDNLPILFSVVIVLYFTKLNKVYAVLMLIFSLLIFYTVQSVFITHTFTDEERIKIYHIFFIHSGADFEYLVSSNLGIASLQTSFFGAFSCSAIVILVMNRYSNFSLPKYFILFSKERLVPFMLLPIIILNSILFLIIWPYLAIGIAQLMLMSTNLNYGFDAFIYGFITRVLKPFGFHGLFTHLVLESKLGGTLIIELDFIQEFAKKYPEVSHHNLFEFFIKFSNNSSRGTKGVIGQKDLWDLISSLNFNELPINATETMPILPWINKNFGVHLGKFSQDYAIYLGLSFGICGGIIFAIPKDQRKNLLKIVIPVLFISFFSGITEPLEFILLFSLPWLYFLFYAPLSGLSLLLMKVFNANIGGNFLKGIIDFINYGIIPYAKGTKFWVVFPIAFFEFGIGYCVFYLWVKKYQPKQLLHVNYNALYLSKNNYQNLMSLGFEKNPVIQVDDSLKNHISNFLLEGIREGKYQVGDKLPSEEGLAVQFNCSRLTARSALIKLVENGVLFSVKGQGYYLSQHGINHLLNPNNLSLNYDHQTINLVSNQDIYFSLEWVKNFSYDFNEINLKKTYNLEKKYFDKNSNLMLYEIAILNQNEVPLEDYSQINQSLLQYLSLQGFNLTNYSSRVFFIDSQKYFNIAHEMGYKDDYPVVVSVLANKWKWVEITVQIMPMASFNFSRDYKIVSSV